MKLTKIYTCTGDNGTTSLVGGQRTSKASARLEAYGTMDELSSHIGLLIAHISSGQNSQCKEQEDITAMLERIQCNIFNICTFLATDTNVTPIYPSARLDESEIAAIEQQIDYMNASIPPLNSFILPGGNIAAAQCHVCRTVCRRAERRIISLYEEAFPTRNETQDEANSTACTMLCYVNRLSDYLFVLARKLNIINGTDEKLWQNTCK